MHDGLTLAIVGRPNAGKSSLFNRLVERDRAIVTATPGTTRDLVTERISIGGIPIELVDTAGLREGREEIEQLGIARSRQALADAALVLIVLDATLALNDEEHRLLAAVEGRPALIANNKSDLVESARSESLCVGESISLGAPGPSHLGTRESISPPSLPPSLPPPSPPLNSSYNVSESPKAAQARWDSSGTPVSGKCLKNGFGVQQWRSDGSHRCLCKGPERLKRETDIARPIGTAYCSI